MLKNQAMDALDLDATETHAALKSNRLEPKLGELFLSFHVDVRRLLAIARVEKEPIRTKAQHRRHPTMMDRLGSLCNPRCQGAASSLFAV